MECDTKYPLLFLRGFAFRDKDESTCWGRIPSALKSRGAQFYVGYTDGLGTCESNAVQVSRRIDGIINSTGAEKVNIIAHSKGGLDARCAAALYDSKAERIASITMLCTPNRGLRTYEAIAPHIPDKLIKAVSKLPDAAFRLMGDELPDLYSSLNTFSVREAAIFNEKYPDVPGIYYQSYSSLMKNPLSDPFFALSSAAMYLFDGSNDGLVSKSSAAWGEYKGEIKKSFISRIFSSRRRRYL